MKAIHCKFHPLYQDLDKDSARCRLNQATINKFLPMAKIGYILKLKVLLVKNGPEIKSVITLQTLWPDIYQSLEDDCSCINPLIQMHEGENPEWVEADCEVCTSFLFSVFILLLFLLQILEVIVPRLCSSVKYSWINHHDKENEYFIAGALTGIPVCSNFHLRIPFMKDSTVLIK
jgi:hypothetical protein